MISKADVIVIGSGGLGAATAYYLSKRKGLSVALIDKHDIGSQTSPRAAGMVSCTRKGDLMTSLIKDACRKIEAFTEETGQPLDWVHSGSLKIARRPQDAEVIQVDFERGRRMGLDVELISAEQASRLNPFLKPSGVVGVMRIGDDRYFDPTQVAVGFARAAAAQGATLLPKTDVLAVNIGGGKVTGVNTVKGTIEGPVVVDAAGAWTRQVAEASGIRVPLVPTRQQLIVTEPLAGARAELPMVRIMDAAVYMRPCQGGFLWGVYEDAPRFFDMQSLGPGFDVKDMPLDIEILHSAATEVTDQLPILQKAKVREFRGGIPTMTADGHHILGPVPGIDGFHFASGCNVAGLSISPTVGEALATWIVDGKPPVDLSPMSVMRFKDTSWSEAELQREAAWQYRHFYGAV
ncbi:MULTISPECIES: NAD(P)/FAD-dependent oxidoreductase [unclassified Mesorhizobium]|uniref:NAD(P)/FAD-dependent oxidoreductase n=1 Tax=unclassified Mesorhizobium TaxID=325217 RepID=UPI001CCD485B|nr:MULTISPECIES: FAD-binding oxidoreductase [unclassified Mesorhizobium]MBZ9681148.1 FAD-binding oxidoreductase [Mesorhizobium sp. CO1-1-2]MBZ9927246.1 FAD-binding oxidoreductase [Mesorhizobium sp. BR1-1-4]